MPNFYVCLLFVALLWNFMYTSSYGCYEAKNKRYAPFFAVLVMNAVLFLLFLLNIAE